jgi:hypothetical protein
MPIQGYFAASLASIAQPNGLSGGARFCKAWESTLRSRQDEPL